MVAGLLLPGGIAAGCVQAVVSTPGPPACKLAHSIRFHSMEYEFSITRTAPLQEDGGRSRFPEAGAKGV